MPWPMRLIAPPLAQNAVVVLASTLVLSQLILGQTTPSKENDYIYSEAAAFDEIQHWKDFPYPLLNYTDPLTMFGLPSSDRMEEIFGPDISKTLVRVVKEMADSCQGYASIYANVQAAFLHQTPLKEKDRKAVLIFLQTVRFSARDLTDFPQEGSIIAEWQNATRSDDSSADEQTTGAIESGMEKMDGLLEQDKGILFDLPKLVFPNTGVLFGIEPLNETLRKDYGNSAPIVARVAEDIARVLFRSYVGSLAAVFRDDYLNMDYFKDKRRERVAIALLADRILEATEEAGLDKRPTIFDEWSMIENGAATTTTLQPET